MTGQKKERGVALIMVIVVLMALMVIATPFTISMRNQSRKSTELLNDERALRDCELVKNLLLDRIKDTHPDRDLATPFFDDAGEWALDRDSLPFPLAGTGNLERIFSARATDLQGLINLNTASIYLMANLFGRRTFLVEATSEDSRSLAVRDAEAFPEEGLLWIEGCAYIYGSRLDDSFEDAEPCVELANLEDPIIGAKADGAEVLDYRSFLLATFPYKWEPGTLSLLPTVESVRNIAVFGEESLLRSELDAVSQLVTVRSGLPAGRTFVNAQRVLGASGAAEERVLSVPNGRYIGSGSIVRLRVGEDTHLSLVIKTEQVDEHSWAVLLQEPVPFSIEGEGDPILDVLARHPVNLNTAPAAVIAACLEGLGLAGSAQRIHDTEALLIAKTIREREAPFTSWLDLDNFLEALAEENDRVSEFHRQVILINGLNSNDVRLKGGTAPFTFSSSGFFAVDTAVSLDFAESGREASRRFMREVLHAAPRGPVMHLFHTQEDFEGQRRLTREGRGYMTLPVNVNLPDRSNLPPSLLGSILTYGQSLHRDGDGSALKLAPFRVAGERTIHFDTDGVYAEPDENGTEGADLSDDTGLPGSGSGGMSGSGGTPKFRVSDIFKKEDDKGDEDGGEPNPAQGGSVVLGVPVVTDGDCGGQPCPDPEGFITGGEVVRLSTADYPCALLDGPFERVWPFSVELWYRFDRLGGAHYIFDTGLQEEFDRIYLFFDGSELIFRVADATEPMSILDPGSPLEHGEIRYDFADLPLEENVFYHIACMAKGTRPSDLCLFVDGVPRGKRSFQTRLVSNLDRVQKTLFTSRAPTVRPPDERIEVADATRFPRRGVLRIGNEIVEYQSHDEDTFFARPDRGDRFGGRTRRDTFPDSHEETEIVELYGYSSALRSEIVPKGKTSLGRSLGAFMPVIVDNDEVADVTLSILDNQAGEYTIGRGFEFDTISTLPLLSVDGSALGGNEFQKGGGFAIIFSDVQVSIDVPDPENPGQTISIYFGRGDSGRPKTPDGSLINGIEVIEYESFDGKSLTGIKRGWAGGYPMDTHKPIANLANPGLPKSEGAGSGGGSGGSPSAGTPMFIRQRAFWTENILTGFQGLEMEKPRVFVFPISIDVEAGAGIDLYADFYSEPSAEVFLPEIVQIGLDFDSTGSDETEWVRYDTVVGDRFIRDDPDVLLDSARFLLPLCFDENKTPEPIAVADGVNKMIKFRAAHNTAHSSHSGGAPVLPVFRTEFSLETTPGRYDNITLTDVDGDRESAIINYAAYNDTYHRGVTMVALRDVVLGEFRRVDIDRAALKQQMKSKEEGAVEEAKLTEWNLESRDYTRIIKFPSGELPASAADEFVLGGNFLGDPSPSPGCIDEVRFGSFGTPHADLPRFARYVLHEELEPEEIDSVLRLSRNTLSYNRRRLTDSLLEELDILGQIPKDASFMLIGDEIIACSEVDTEEGYVAILPDGRGVFGTEPGYHPPGEEVVVLNFPALTYLKGNINPRDWELSIEDAGGFPFSGAVLIDNEVIGYDRLEDGALTMPQFSPYGEGRPCGLFRGRFGTEPAEHYEGGLVYFLPTRYPDLYTPGSDSPESGCFTFGVEAPGAFFSEVNWIEKGGGAGADLVLLTRVGGRGSWGGYPAESKDLFLFEDPAGKKHRNHVVRQGDYIEIRVFTRYGREAFDPLDYAANGWKRAPLLEALSVECLEPSRVFRHEEWK
jgi:hypothetical protein